MKKKERDRGVYDYEYWWGELQVGEANQEGWSEDIFDFLHKIVNFALLQ